MTAATEIDGITYRALVAKRAAGISLSRSETRQVAEFEVVQQAAIGTKYVQNLPKSRLFEWSGRQSKQWLEWHKRYNVPYVPDRLVKFVDLTKIVYWLAEFLSTHHDELSRVANDPMIVATSTHSERYRAAKADMAEDERDVKRRQLLPREPVHQILVRWSACLRKAGDEIRRRYGNDAGDMLLEALDKCESILSEELEARR